MIKVWVCNGKACTDAGTQDTVKKWLLAYFKEKEIGEHACLGLCHNNFSILYKNKAYSAVSQKTLKRIIENSDY
jgi:NADH:ubiquinone oxidoreductase subunit E